MKKKNKQNIKKNKKKTKIKKISKKQLVTKQNIKLNSYTHMIIPSTNLSTMHYNNSNMMCSGQKTDKIIVSFNFL
jgi:hypothetical protein